MPLPTLIHTVNVLVRTWKPLVHRAMNPPMMLPEKISRSPDPAGFPSTVSFAPTFRISAAATPSGYGRSLCTTIARRSGIVKSTPRQPPHAETSSVCQNSNPCQ